MSDETKKETTTQKEIQETIAYAASVEQDTAEVAGVVIAETPDDTIGDVLADWWRRVKVGRSRVAAHHHRPVNHRHHLLHTAAPVLQPPQFRQPAAADGRHRNHRHRRGLRSAYRRDRSLHRLRQRRRRRGYGASPAPGRPGSALAPRYRHFASLRPSSSASYRAGLSRGPGRIPSWSRWPACLSGAASCSS